VDKKHNGLNKKRSFQQIKHPLILILKDNKNDEKNFGFFSLSKTGKVLKL